MAQEYLNTEEQVKRIRGIIGKGSRFNVNIDELRQYNPKLANYVMKHPIEAIKMFEEHLNGQIKTLQEDTNSKMGNEKQTQQSSDINFPKKMLIYHINFEGNFGTNHITPRGLKANLVNEMVTVQGIVTRMSLVQPKMQTSVHYCEATSRGTIKNYTDENNLAQIGAHKVGDSNNTIPTADVNGNPFSTEYGYCIYKDSQTVTIQEMPERAPTGQLPRSIVVVLENDLVDKLKPGDRVEVTGVYRCVPGMNTGSTNGVFKPVLVATGAKNIMHDKEKPIMTDQDIKNIRKISKEKDLFNIMGNSIASTIEGYLQVKKAILLMLLGGAEKNLENGTHLRGDINLMMVGDPSTAKSQLLRHVIDIAPLAINTTGRGSSGVGLTAAVTCDKDTGEKHLEAGAMVLADRGVVCIDEFDKMNDVDRVAIHEVMEQQTVTIAKAGLHVSLNARCSVIAAANPIYGEYARDESVAKNIGLPDSLLSRFDLLFVMLDEKDAESDRRIAEKVIMNHRYIQNNNGESQSHFNYINDDVIIEKDHAEKRDKDEKNTAIYEKYAPSTKGADKGLVPLTREFLKKYISFAKSQKAPELDQDCIEYAAMYYSTLRTKANNYNAAKIAVPITVRTLETMIRLATSHAKLRLSKAVEPSDIDVAVLLLNECIFQETQGGHGGKEEDSENEEMYDANEEEIIKTNTAQTRAQRMAVKESKMEVIESPNTKQTKPEVVKQQAKPKAKPQTKKVEEDYEEAEEEEEEEYKGSQSSTRAQRAEQRLRDSQPITPSKKVTQPKSQPSSETKSNKKVRIDHNEEVSELFQSKLKPDKEVALDKKRFVFKLVNDLKDKQNKAFVDNLWKQYLMMPETQTISKQTRKQMIETKVELIEIVEALERDNLVMYAPDDGAVIMI